MILMLYLPIFILGENSFILIADVIDSEFAWLHVLKLNNQLFSFNGSLKIENFMNGLPRKYIQSEFDFKRVLFYIFPSFWAYIISSVLIRLIGFIGIYLIIRDFFTITNKKIIFLICLCFSLVPVYTIYGLSIMGQPFLFWAFLNLKNNKNKISNFLLIFLFPFYSHIALVGPFILFGLILFWLYNFIIRNEKINIYYWVGVLILLIGFILANINMLFSYFSGELTYRSVRLFLDKLPTFNGYLFMIFRTFFFGHIHPANFISLPITVLFLYVVLSGKSISKIVIHLFIFITVTSIIFASSDILNHYLSAYFPILKTFNISRVIFLNPIIFFFILIILINQNNIKIKFVYYILFFQLFLNILSTPEISYNLLGKIINRNILDDIIDVNRPAYKLYNLININFKRQIVNNYNSEKNEISSFKEFYSYDLFKKVDKYINLSKKKYRIVSFGIPPSIAQYNGFYCLDGDFDLYSAKYYNMFRKIISNEIEKNETIKKKYDYGGAQAFIYSSEIIDKYFNNCNKYAIVSVKNLSINTKQLKLMGCKYIFSGVPIENFKQLNLDFEKLFTDSISIYKVYLYKL